MDHESGPWKMAFSHGPTSMVQFLENRFTMPLDPSLGVNQMWTKRNDHAPNVNMLTLLNICPQRAVVKNNKSRLIISYLLLSSSLSQKNISLIMFYCNIMALPWALAFFYWRTYFASPIAKYVGPYQRMMYALKYAFWGPQTPWLP
jgi:hypothetical protein